MADLRFDVSAETRAATAALGAFAQDVQRRLVQAVRALPDIELTADSSDAQREMKRLRDELAALANQRVGVDVSAEDALAEMNRLQSELRALGGSTTEVGVRADVGAAEAALGDIEAEIRRLNGQDVEVEVEADTAAAQAELGSFADGAKAGLAAAGAAAGGLFAVGLAASMEVDAAQARLAAQLGNTGEYSREMGGIAGSLYANAYGESLSEVGDAVRAVVNSGALMEDATNEQIESITGRVLSLAQAFDLDAGQAINQVGQLMRNGLAPDAETALDIITTGFQQGVNKADDFLDVIEEYSVQFAQMGLSAEDATGLMIQGLQAGARDADIVADAIKEFALIAVDATGSAGDGYRALGLDAEEMAAKVAAGGPQAKEALDQVLDGLRAIEDPTLRGQVALDLFGTKAEDLQGALFALDPSEAAGRLGDFAGAAEEVDAAMGGTMEAKVTGLQRGFDNWARSLVETQGPLGEVGAMMAAFGPMAMGAIAAIGPLVLAMKMGGVAAAVRGASGAVDEVGDAADRSSGRTGRLSGVLRAIGPAAGVIGAALLIDQATNQGLSDALNHLAGFPDAAERARRGIGPDFWSQTFQAPAPNPGDPWDIRNLPDTLGDVWAAAQRELSGFQLDPIEIDVLADPEGARASVDQLLADVNGVSGEVNINGNSNPAGFALRQVLAEIAAGAETVMIDGNEVPAQEALALVKEQISTASGDVTINGETMPAGEALAMLMGEVAATSGRVLIGADPAQAVAQLTTVQDHINAAMGTVTVNGNTMPADQSLGAVLAAIDAGAAEVDINGSPVPAALALNSLIAQIDEGAGTVTINGNQVPAGQVLAALVQTISSAQGTATINGQATPGYNALNGFLAAGNRAVTTPQVNADTNRANGQLSALYTRWNGRVISLQASTAGRLAAGGVVSASATAARFYASGGIDQPMVPMPVGVPAVAQPGMLRVFGDRSDVNESYIPWKRGDQRANALLQVTADALGYVAVPRDQAGTWYANGGVSLADPDLRAAAREIADRMRSGQSVYEDFTFRGASALVGRYNEALLDGYAASGRAMGTLAWLESVARGPQTSADSTMSTEQVRAAVTSGPVAQAGAAAGVMAVADAALRAEVAALRRDQAGQNYGPAQLSVLRALLAAAQSGGGYGSALADAADGARRAERGAW